jgi:hypothetical protein
MVIQRQTHKEFNKSIVKKNILHLSVILGVCRCLWMFVAVLEVSHHTW